MAAIVAIAEGVGTIVNVGLGIISLAKEARDLITTTFDTGKDPNEKHSDHMEMANWGANSLPAEVPMRPVESIQDDTASRIGDSALYKMVTGPQQLFGSTVARPVIGAANTLIGNPISAISGSIGRMAGSRNTIRSFAKNV